MIIGTCGYSWSGSSAAADYLAEFEENLVYNEEEFVLAFYPDGLQDLDYHLNKKCAKFISSTVAIPRFKKAAHYLLNDSTHGEIDRITEKYIDNLVQVRWRGMGQGQSVLHKGWVYKYIAEKFTKRIIRRLPEKVCQRLNIFPITDMQYSICPENFLEKTIEYTEKILKSIGLDTEKNIVLDQPFPGNNPVSSMKYYKDSRCIVVDRDPRDLYLLAKKYFPSRSYQVPHRTSKEFIDYYYHMHKLQKNWMSNDHVLLVQFEDLIFQYENTTKKIAEFLNLGDPKFKGMQFQPEKSMANTRLFLNTDEYKEDIKAIEHSLAEYLYDFSKYSNVTTKENVFDENPPIRWRER